ncbi:hypothetical protein FPZ43_05225 [Mucilaginibacter pallidiroseus]|uniref:Uncharacterized protein n=1 Tax=Mucilaginibacter pallidiroseus TaxID=2599295 RepID=A0A563UG62_9SPHI|nr:hypothetical protein [Mucilaginibacter pallidiroseus]TWR30344.1 hypothetical protein FPZ43_05225 [Mucilaginibacter pallidiroseus]
MANRILLSTYNLKVSVNASSDAILSQFDGSNDFLELFKGFMDDVFTNIKAAPSLNDRSILHLALDEPVTVLAEKRAIYGFISSGVNEDRFTVREGDDKKFESDPVKHVTYRNLFFYIEFPIGKTYAYLIIQKKRDIGAKGLLSKSLNLYLRERGYPDYNVVISNLLNKRVYDKMMLLGNLKKIDFIKRSIPNTIEELYDNEQKEYSDKGTLTTTIQSRSSLSNYWKSVIHNLFVGENKNSVIELNSKNDSVDEVEFQLEFKGKIKTFHVLQKHRTQPDIDVTGEVEIIDNQPTTESLIEVSQGLINDILTLKPVNA